MQETCKSHARRLLYECVLSAYTDKMMICEIPLKLNSQYINIAS